VHGTQNLGGGRGGGGCESHRVHFWSGPQSCTTHIYIHRSGSHGTERHCIGIRNTYGKNQSVFAIRNRIMPPPGFISRKGKQPPWQERGPQLHMRTCYHRDRQRSVLPRVHFVWAMHQTKAWRLVHRHSRFSHRAWIVPAPLSQGRSSDHFAIIIAPPQQMCVYAETCVIVLCRMTTAIAVCVCVCICACVHSNPLDPSSIFWVPIHGKCARIARPRQCAVLPHDPLAA